MFGTVRPTTPVRSSCADMLPGLGFVHLAVIAVVALLVLGPDKLPDLAQRAGRGYRDLQRLREHLQLDVESLLGDTDDHTDLPSAAAPLTVERDTGSTAARSGARTTRPARHVPPTCPGTEATTRLRPERVTP